MRGAIFDHTPDNLVVNAEVCMGQDVPQARDFPPFHLGMRVPEVCRESLHSLADNLEVPSDGVVCLVVPTETGEIQSLCESKDSITTLLDVLKE
jgi:hypothetical protein